ncbi:hypothetical protein ACWEVD_22125 [Nocardia thailandica]
MSTVTEAAPSRVLEQFEQLVAALRGGGGRDPELAGALTELVMAWNRPLRIQIAGRAHSGRSTVREALALMTAQETEAVDLPGGSDPVLDGDLVVYVLSGGPQPADLRVLAGLPRDRTVVVLNKADAVGSRWSEAVAAADRYGRELGLQMVPVVASLAVRTKAGVVGEADLADLRRLAADPSAPAALAVDLFTAPGPDEDVRRRLLADWDLFGVDTALAALRADPDLSGPALIQILHAASGIDPLYRLVHRRYEQAGALRDGALLDDLRRLAARAVPVAGSRGRALIGEFLAGDDAVWMGLCAGLACPEVAHLAAGYRSPAPADADEAIDRAVRWRAIVASDMPPAARRAALRVHDGYVRAWERMSSAGL